MTDSPRDSPAPLWPIVSRVLRHPSRLSNIRHRESRAAFARVVRRRIAFLTHRPTSTTWAGTEGPVDRKLFDSYDDYVDMQRSKLAMVHTDAYDRRFAPALRERLAALPVEWPGRSVVCLAARHGAEVEVFQDLGAFAVGIDLNPGDDNRLVLPGDFHDVQFPDESAQTVYCNSIDHAFDLSKMLAEVVRVLAPGGRAILEVMEGADEGGNFGRWETTRWATVDSLVEQTVAAGLHEVGRIPMTEPWPGFQLLLAVSD
ncbi:MAG: class I SAM-dependent methyltransferase [Acidimicrobiia bacterium]|nr:class I SAM-dependent methyltransferase [Acidimicrobiia bacterium]